jgi:hypothetical protein
MTKWNLQHLYDKGLDVDLKNGIATPKKTKYSNKKVENNGHKFDSRIESNFYNMLRLNNIEFTMKEVFILQDKFRYLDEAVREIKIIPDFLVKKNGETICIIDTKGMITDLSKMKYKMLKAKLEKQIPIFMPTNKAKCEEAIRKILELIK